MVIKFKNWIVPRKDIKHPRYFACHHDYFISTKFYGFTSEELLCVFYLLCEASRNNKNGEVEINREHARIHNRVQSGILDRTIKKLVKIKELEQPRVRGTYAICTLEERRGEENRIEENKILSDSPKVEPRRVIDFEALYQKYPRKEGKSSGLKTCKAQIKTEADYEMLSGAIDRYAEHCRTNVRETRFIKIFSTFMNQWRDWLDPDTGTAVKAKTNLEKWAEKNEAEDD